MPTNEPVHADPKAKAIPTPDPDSAEEQAKAGASIPPEPFADDPVVGPQDDSWRHPEPAVEPKRKVDDKGREVT
jgi:hypothetical protein